MEMEEGAPKPYLQITGNNLLMVNSFNKQAILIWDH